MMMTMMMIAGRNNEVSSRNTTAMSTCQLTFRRTSDGTGMSSDGA